MREILSEVNGGCEWVLNGEGIATRKYDGTCCKIEDGMLYKRREVKPGKQIPSGFIAEDYDKITGKTFGWLPVSKDNPEDKYHIIAYNKPMEDGTYELLGEKIQGNPEHIEGHILFKHSNAEKYENCPRSYNGLKEWLSDKDIEGIVFHHPDGRMAKIKKRDFGMGR